MTRRRIGAESSETRALIVKSAEHVIREEGYAAASTRRVAQHAGVKPSLVHYYFPTTDDLLMAVFRQGAAQSDAMIEDALASDDPLQALWSFFTDASRTALSVEFLALANHRPAIRAEIAKHSEYMRGRQAAQLAAALGPVASAIPPEALSVVLAGIGRAIVMEGGLGIASGHAEARTYVEGWLRALFTASQAAPVQTD